MLGRKRKQPFFFVDACVCLNVNHAFFHSLQRVIATWKRHNIELHWVKKTEGKNIKNTSQVANWYARRMNNFHKIFKNKKTHWSFSFLLFERLRLHFGLYLYTQWAQKNVQPNGVIVISLLLLYFRWICLRRIPICKLCTRLFSS